MSKISELNKTFIYFLIFTIISSVIAYQLVIRAYDKVFALSSLEYIE